MSLYEPIPPPVKDRFWSLGNPFSSDHLSVWRRKARRLVAARESAAAAWQDDPRRWELAQTVSAMAKKKLLGLPNDCFLPEDSFVGILLTRA